jgi:plasmid rolling circle replication initiator protein Rep
MSYKPLSSKDLNENYLSTISPKDKSWDKHKFNSEQVERLYQNTIFDKYAGKIAICSGYLGFKWVIDEKTGELRLKLNSCHFCRVRHCPMCSWRRSLKWSARFLTVLPSIVADYPTHKFIFLTLTVKNCNILSLKETLKWMNAAWQKMIKRKSFPAVGFIKSVEVTKSADGMAHPHFHAVLMVESGYFSSYSYLNQTEWTEMWRSCLKVGYTPIVNVKSIKNTPRRHANTEKLGELDLDSSDTSQRILEVSERIARGLIEVCKYSVKPEDIMGTGSQEDREWLVNLTIQLHGTRAISIGGILKNYLSEEEPEDLIGNDNLDDDKLSDVMFKWKTFISKYVVLKAGVSDGFN